MTMTILTDKINRTDLIKQYMNFFPSMIKAVVDVETGAMAIDAELHADLEALLLENDSIQDNLWGINIYPNNEKARFIEFTSLINIRPHQNNPSMEVRDAAIKDKISAIVMGLVNYDA